MAQDNEGRTALMWAVMKGQVETVKVILDAAQDKDAVAMVRDHEGWSALFHAVSAGRTDLISAIIRGVRDRMTVIQGADYYGLSALNVASARRDIKSAAAVMAIFS